MKPVQAITRQYTGGSDMSFNAPKQTDQWPSQH